MPSTCNLIDYSRPPQKGDPNTKEIIEYTWSWNRSDNPN